MDKAELSREIRKQLDSVQVRWRRGIDAFQQTLDDISRLKDESNLENEERKIVSIRSAIHGDIRINRLELKLIDSFFLQRLRDVSQMGLLNLVYPDARHSRFEHTLGVFHMAKRLLQREELAATIPRLDRKDLLYATILHDIGHGPFSHATETILDSIGLDSYLRVLRNKYHEERSVSIILDNDFQLKRLGRREYGVQKFLQLVGANPGRVRKLIIGGDDWLAPVLNGPIDVDKLDYFQRDAYYTGVPAGAVDADRILAMLQVELQGGSPVRIAFEEKAVNNLLGFLYARHFVYGATVFHPVVAIVESMLVIAFDLALGFLDEEAKSETVFSLELMDDSDLTRFLETIAVMAEDSKEKSILGGIVGGFRSRTLLKRIRMLSLAETMDGLNFEHASEMAELLGTVIYFDIAAFENSAIEQLEAISSGIREGIVALVLQAPPRDEQQIMDSFERVSILRENVSVPLTSYLAGKNPAGKLSVDAKAHGAAGARLGIDLWKAQLVIAAEHRDSAVRAGRLAELGEILWKQVVASAQRARAQEPKIWNWRPNLEFHKGLIAKIRRQLES